MAELEDFLDSMHFVMPNLNDTFGYAAADSEKLYMEQENLEMLVNVWRKYGHHGIVAYVAKVRGTDPIPPWQTEEYWSAMKELEGWEYWDD